MNAAQLQTLLPHRRKMFLLSRVLSWDFEKGLLKAEYDIGEGGLFFDKALGGMPAWAGFELMAQSISALSGLRRRARGENPLFGFILSVSELVVHVPVLRGTAAIEIEEDTVLDNVASFRCRVLQAGEEGVGAKLTIMETADFSLLNNP